MFHLLFGIMPLLQIPLGGDKWNFKEEDPKPHAQSTLTDDVKLAKRHNLEESRRRALAYKERLEAAVGRVQACLDDLQG